MITTNKKLQITELREPNYEGIAKLVKEYTKLMYINKDAAEKGLNDLHKFVFNPRSIILQD